MERADVDAALAQVFRDVFRDPALTVRAEMTGRDIPGWDSIKMLTLVATVEDRFGIRISGADIDRLNCVGDLSALVAAKTG
jgi:acyl carrier protein